MPLFDLKCDGCGVLQRDVWLRAEESVPMCASCGCSQYKHHSPPRLLIFKPHYEDDLDVTPVYVESRKQLKQEAAARGLIVNDALT